MSTVSYQVVSYGPYTLAVGLVGAHPDRVWLLGWLRDHIVREPKLKRPAIEAARVLADLVEAQWGESRPYLVEVQWADRLGTVRIAHEPSGEVRH